MSSERDNRQRAAARARLEREMATRQEAARRKRVLQARVGAGVAAVVVLGAVVWIIAAATGGSSSTPAAAGESSCTWTDALAGQPTPEPDPSSSASASASPGASPTRVLPAGISDVGKPPVDVPRKGYQVLTFDTNLGVIKVQINLAKTPCTGASMAYLAGKGFYDNSACHRLVDEIFAVQCGDPSGTGSGGVTYQVADENLPTGKLPAYHAGDVAMANIGSPNTNGSQFFFIFGNSQLQGQYTLWGRVIEGEDIVKKVGTGGNDGAFNTQGQAGGGHPKIKLTFMKVTAGPVTDAPQPEQPIAPDAPTASGTPSTTPTARAS